MVKVSQAPAVPEASSGATPTAGGASLVALPSAVQDLARFFLSLSGSSSLGAVGGAVGLAASAVGSGVQLWPSTSAGGAVALGAAVPGVSGHQQHQEASRSSRRCCRSSSNGTNRRSKRPRGRSPSPGPSSRHREKHYRTSSISSEEDRADASSPGAGLAPGGTSGDFRSAPADDRSPRPGPSGWTSRPSVRAEHF